MASLLFFCPQKELDSFRVQIPGGRLQPEAKLTSIITTQSLCQPLFAGHLTERNDLILHPSEMSAKGVFNGTGDLKSLARLIGLHVEFLHDRQMKNAPSPKMMGNWFTLSKKICPRPLSALTVFARILSFLNSAVDEQVRLDRRAFDGLVIIRANLSSRSWPCYPQVRRNDQSIGSYSVTRSCWKNRSTALPSTRGQIVRSVAYMHL